MQAGQGIPLSTYLQPALGLAPRFGVAYDLTGRQQIVLRGGGGLYFDRPSGNAVFGQVLNPPARKSVTLRFGQLQTLGAGGLATEAPSSLTVYEYDSPLPASWQWNAGAQMALPWSTVVDVSYVGQHGYNIVEGINLNGVDFGTAFLAENQDPNAGADHAGGDLAGVRSDAGVPRVQRDHAERQPRMGHASFAAALVQPPLPQRPVVRVQRHDRSLEQAAASARACSTTRTGRSRTGPTRPRPTGCFQTPPTRHTMKGNFVWDLPDLRASAPALRAIGLRDQ